MSSVAEERGHPDDAVDTPGSASGCHVVLQNHEGTGPTVGSRGVIWGMVSPFHPVQVPLHVQMKDTHKTNNPGYFLKLIAHKEGERTQLFGFQESSAPVGQNPLQGIWSLSALSDQPSPPPHTPIASFSLCTAPHLLRAQLLCQTSSSTKAMKCTHKMGRRGSLGQKSRSTLKAAAGSGKGLPKTNDTQHPLHFPTCLSSWGDTDGR